MKTKYTSNSEELALEVFSVQKMNFSNSNAAKILLKSAHLEDTV